MRILLVNDDGIDSKGILILEKALERYGEVIVVAPSTGMSAKSHAIMLKDPIKLEEVRKNHYAIEGYPADCVRLGFDLFGEFDYVFSGINDGLNLGTDVMYSGTCSAALEASIAGVKSVAISTDYDCFDIVEAEIDSLLAFLFYNDIFDNEATINVNFPTKNFSSSVGTKLCIQGKKEFKSFFKLTAEGYIAYSHKTIYDDNELTDVYLANKGYITICPLSKLQTDMNVYSYLKNKI